MGGEVSLEIGLIGAAVTVALAMLGALWTAGQRVGSANHKISTLEHSYRNEKMGREGLERRLFDLDNRFQDSRVQTARDFVSQDQLREVRGEIRDVRDDVRALGERVDRIPGEVASIVGRTSGRARREP